MVLFEKFFAVHGHPNRWPGHDTRTMIARQLDDALGLDGTTSRGAMHWITILKERKAITTLVGLQGAEESNGFVEPHGQVSASI
jgi:hypothetical protein